MCIRDSYLREGIYWKNKIIGVSLPKLKKQIIFSPMKGDFMKKTKKGIALLTMSAVLAGIVPVGTSGLQEVQAADLPKALVDFRCV